MAPMVVRRALVALVAAAMPLLLGCTKLPEEMVVPVSDVAGTFQGPALPPLAATMAQQTTADVLYSVYSQNLILGATPDQRFLNRPLLVSAVFNGINDQTPNRTYLELRTHEDGAFAYAVLGLEAQALLATLMPGQRVLLLCRGAGSVGGSPILMNCRGV